MKIRRQIRWDQILVVIVSISIISFISPPGFQQEQKEKVIKEYHQLLLSVKRKRNSAPLIDELHKSFFSRLTNYARHRFEKKKKSNRIRKTALQILGEARASSEDVVDTLIEEISFKPNISRGFDHWSEAYPALKALIRIGKPASKAAIKRIYEFKHLDRKEVQTRIKMLLYLIKKVEGKELGLFLLNNAKQKTLTKQEEKNYKQAISWFQKPIMLD